MVTHTPEQIAALADGLTKLECKKIQRARYVGGDYRMMRGDARGLNGRGLVWRFIDGYYLTETGLAVRKHLEARNG